MSDGLFDRNMIPVFLPVNSSFQVQKVNVGISVGVIVSGNLNFSAFVDDVQNNGEINHPPGMEGVSDVNLEIVAPINGKTFLLEGSLPPPPFALVASVCHETYDPLTRRSAWQSVRSGSLVNFVTGQREKSLF